MTPKTPSKPPSKKPAATTPSKKAKLEGLLKLPPTTGKGAAPVSTLAQVRGGIDAIDDLVLTLLNARARLAQEAGKLKKTATPYDPGRETAIFTRLSTQNRSTGGPLEDVQVRAIFAEIISACRGLQEPPTVSCLGPLGSFSHEAARRIFGHSAVIQPEPDFAEAITAVATGTAHFAVAPVENTTEGVVAATLDAIQATPQVQIFGEYHLPVAHHLLGRGEWEDATRLATFSQPLGQCRRWREAHGKHLDLVQSPSTAAAAQLAAQDDRVVAIAGELAAQTYGLKILKRNIHDHANNTTRFLILSRTPPPPSRGQHKTSLCFTLKHEPGSLARLLTAFSKAGVNLTFIESRPVQGVLYEYRFFVDFLSGVQGKEQAALMKAIEKQVSTLRVLGVYPVAE